MQMLDMMRKRKLSAKRVAERIGCGVSTVYAWAAGTRRPNVPALRALAKLFRLTPDRMAEALKK